MNKILHICQEDSCPVQDTEIAKLLENGFTLSYVPWPEAKEMTSPQKEREDTYF